MRRRLHLEQMVWEVVEVECLQLVLRVPLQEMEDLELLSFDF
jgi:hypothetical protein